MINYNDFNQYQILIKLDCLIILIHDANKHYKKKEHVKGKGLAIILSLWIFSISLGAHLSRRLSII